MSKKSIQKIDINSLASNVSGADKDLLPPEMMQALEDKLPPFIKEYMADGTKIMQWNHEFLILLEEILRQDFGFSEENLEQIEKRVKELLPIAHKMKLEDTRLLRKGDFALAIEMAERNKFLEKMRQNKISAPTKEQIKKLT